MQSARNPCTHCLDGSRQYHAVKETARYLLEWELPSVGCMRDEVASSIRTFGENESISHSKDLLASISHSSHASSKSHSHTVPRSPTHTIAVHTVLVCTSTYSVLYVLLRIPYWMYLYVLNSTCTRTSSTYRSTYMYI